MSQARPAAAGPVLVTGAAGQIGSVLCAGLAELGWSVRGLDVRTPDRQTSYPPGVQTIVADIADRDALDAALTGASAVVHLAGIPSEAPFAEILEANIAGTFEVFEAARRAGARRVVYASSNHAAGFTPRAEQPLPADTAPRPDTYYGLSKAFGEALGRLYVDRYGLAVACLRIGSFTDRPTTPRHLAIWLSPGDLVRLVQACLTAPALSYALVWGISANTRRWWDLEPGRALGYHPRDDSEQYAAEVLAHAEPVDQSDPLLALVGGEFTAPDYRPVERPVERPDYRPVKRPGTSPVHGFGIAL